jgi:hypothetical protein
MLKNWKKGWKVLGKNRQSCTHPYRSHISFVVYPKGEAAFPRKGCGPLAVFKTRRDARRFKILGEKIVKCLYIQSKHALLWEHAYTEQPSPNTLILCHNLRKVFAQQVPDGTDFAYAVKCLE